MAIERPRTAVIGAGISGLTTGKMLTDYGIPYTCFESSDRVGGNWAFGNPNGHSSAYRSLHIDTSKKRLSFADFPIPEHFPDFPHHSEIKQYLDAYTEAFGLAERIEFNNGVDHAERLPGGGWELTTQQGAARRFDALVVANGHHWDPRYPDFPGEFTGQSIHSHHYIDPATPFDLHGKRVLVVGFGNSAVDIASELSQKHLENRVFLSTRSGAWVMPKYLFGKPADQLTKSNPKVPPSVRRKMAKHLPKLVSGKPQDYGLPEPDHDFLEAHPTVSSEILLRIGSGDVQPKPNVQRFDGRQTTFADGTSEEFDAVIFATGYNITFPFFDPEFLSAPDNRFPLYKRILHPEIDDMLFVGFAQPLPTLFPFVELQSRLVARYLAGNYRPPARAAMERIIREDEKLYIGHFADRPRHTQQVDYDVYEYQMQTEELPSGTERARREGPVPLAGRAATADAAAG